MEPDEQRHASPPNGDSPRPPGSALFTLRSGGWVLLLATILVILATGRILSQGARSRQNSRTLGGGTVESYGFDLSTCLIPRREIVAGGVPRDGIPAITDPPIIRASQADFLKPPDRVIGLALGGQARAYPLRVLNWHEVVNDTVGGVPVAVTYCPLCDSAVVFDRRMAGRTLEFGVSGLLYNSNLLMYDRTGGHEPESLWSQLQFRAVAGPAAAAGLRLTVLPADLVRWVDWRERHPETTVLGQDPARVRLYKRDPYASYFGSDRLMFPVSPLPPGDARPDGRGTLPSHKTPVVVIAIGDRRGVYPLPWIAACADAEGRATLRLGSADVAFRYRPDPPTAAVEVSGSDAPVEIVHAFWFAWYAMHPTTEPPGP